MKKIKNPWIEKTKKWIYQKNDFVIPQDKPDINSYNLKLNSKNNKYKIYTNILPEPFSGNFNTAEIFVLCLNPGLELVPGFNEETYEEEIYNICPSFKKDVLKSLSQDNKYDQYPNFNLNPKYKLTGGFRYWTSKFNSFIKNKNSYEKLSKKICIVDYFPYHSNKYSKTFPFLESQRYTFNLVKKVIDKNKLIVITRGKKEWIKEINKLNPKPNWKKNIIETNSKQNIVFSKNNLKNEDYNKIKKILN